jgi:hypothetical protein
MAVEPAPVSVCPTNVLSQTMAVLLDLDTSSPMNDRH